MRRRPSQDVARHGGAVGFLRNKRMPALFGKKRNVLDGMRIIGKNAKVLPGIELGQCPLGFQDGHRTDHAA